jgi:hypothetical protein
MIIAYLVLSIVILLMAGVLGFEPRYAGIKTLCLTAWRHPIYAGLLTVDLHRVNDVYFAISSSFCQQYFAFFLKKFQVFLGFGLLN